jgi:hypothetical protein
MSSSSEHWASVPWKRNKRTGVNILDKRKEKIQACCPKDLKVSTFHHYKSNETQSKNVFERNKVPRVAGTQKCRLNHYQS